MVGSPGGGAGGDGAGAGGDGDDPSWHDEWMVPARKEQGESVRLLVTLTPASSSSFARVTRGMSAFSGVFCIFQRFWCGKKSNAADLEKWTTGNVEPDEWLVSQQKLLKAK